MRTPAQLSRALVLIALAGQVLWGGPRISGPTASPDGRKVAFVETGRATGPPHMLVVLDLDSGDVQVPELPLPRYGFVSGYGVSWGPKGDFLVTTVFEGTPGEGRGRAGVWEIPLVSGTPRKLELPGGGPVCMRGIVSPDGSRVLLLRAARGDLHVLDRATGAASKLRHAAGVPQAGYGWYGDSATVFFSTGDGISTESIEDDEERVLLSGIEGGRVRSVAVSADKRFIAYPIRMELRVVGASPRDSFRVPKIDSNRIQWSSDGNRLLFVSGQRAKILDTTQPPGTPLTDVGPAGRACWARGGRSVLCVRNRAELWEVPIPPGEARRVYSVVLSSTKPGALTRGGEEEPAGNVYSLIRGNSAFAADLYGRLAAEGGNVFFSPYSISTALAMTYAGARGNTAKQMAETLHFPPKSEGVHGAFAELRAAVEQASRSPDVQVCEANSLWPQKGYPFLQGYLDLIQRHYGASITPVDFVSAREAARKLINDWVEERTRGKIRDTIRPGVLTPLTRLVLVNAVYFKGLWQSPFEKDKTEVEPFHLLSGKSIEAPLMHHVPMFAQFGYAELDDMQILELRYRGSSFSMVVLLPKAKDGLPDLEKKLSPGRLTEWMSLLRPRDVEVYLPRFKATCQFRLKRTLSEMGMPDAFSMGADFSGMDGRPHWLYIAAAIHKAYVDVNEEGTEAAAATAVVMAAGGARPKCPTFRADHPFLFLIRERRSESILFMGRLANPTQADG